ncbi:Vesicular integral-membrane protein VIP36 [Astathelohania contejeani]|uniref:Vesicular integral-membrane protein VIP36 n=1 Tax=Astathelohania contejeani TaxID=164912 RepID=A0ABQ7HX99_9MICR|nr:Vesicular integral-membrane protein VIP36 [Thelohania contejeani]
MILSFIYIQRLFSHSVRLHPEISLFAPAVNEKGISNTWNLYNHTLAVTYSSDRTSLRLCYEGNGSTGAMIAKNPLPSDEFQIDIRFAIMESKVSTFFGGSGLAGDGFAMWLTRNGEFKPGNCFGRSNEFDGMLLALNTYKNNKAGKHSIPFLGLACGNNLVYNTSEDGLNIIQSPVILKDIIGKPGTIRIESKQDILKIYISFQNGEFKEIYNLRNPGIGKDYYLGVSASNTFGTYSYRFTGIRTYVINTLGHTEDLKETGRSSKLIWLAFGVIIVLIGYAILTKQVKTKELIK